MGGHKTISGSSYNTPIPPEPDIVVSGEVTPDCTKNYFETGTYEGQPYYVRADGLYKLYMSSMEEFFVISPDFEDMDEEWWGGSPLTPLGEYFPQGTATGVATASEY